MRTARASYTAGPHDPVDVVGGAVRPVGHRPQDGQALRRDLQPVLPEQRSLLDGRFPGHGRILAQILD